MDQSTSMQKTTIQSLPLEILELIMEKWTHLVSHQSKVMTKRGFKELLALRTICRRFSQITLRYVYCSLTLQRRFASFTRSMTANPDRAKYVVELNVFYNPPKDQETTPAIQDAVERIDPLLQSSFTCLRRLSIAAQHLVSALGSISGETSPFPALQTFSTTGVGDREPQININSLQPIWQSPKLQICRLQGLTLLPGNPLPQKPLLPVAETDLSHSEFSCAVLSSLTGVREITKLGLTGSRVLEPYQCVQGIQELTSFPSGAIGEPAIDPHIRVEHLNFSSALKVKIVNSRDLELPHASTLSVQIECCRTDRPMFLAELKQMIKEKMPSTFRHIRLVGLDGAWGRQQRDLRTWNTGGNKVSELSESNDLDMEADYRTFDGYNDLKELCGKRNITLSWKARE